MLLAAAPAQAQDPSPGMLMGTLASRDTGRVLQVDSDIGVAQPFTTGANTGGYTLSSLEAYLTDGPASAAERNALRAELWSAADGGGPGPKFKDLTVPSSLARGVVTFAAPSGTKLSANTTYYFVLYYSGRPLNEYGHSLDYQTSLDAGSQPGWNYGRLYRINNPPGGSSAQFGIAQVLSFRVNGAAIPKTWGVHPVSSSVPAGSSSDVGVELSEPALAGGVTFFLTPRLGTDIPAGLCRRWRAATREDLGASLPSTLKVPVGKKTASVRFPTADNDDLVGGSNECFAVTMSTDARGWSVRGSDSIEVTIRASDSGFVSFGTDPGRFDDHVASVAENVSGGRLNVPVTVNRLPVRTTTVAVEVSGSSTASSGHYSIGTTSLTFGPGDASRTKNVAVTIVDDDKDNGDRTVVLVFGAAPNTLYTGRLNKATLTIVDDDEPIPDHPSSVSVAPGHGNLLVTWSAHTGRLTGYDVHYTSALATGADAVADHEDVQTGMSPLPADGWVNANHSGTIASHTISGLSNGTPYRVRVRANNNVGEGAWAYATGRPVQTTRTFAFALRIGQPTEEGSNATFAVVLGEAAPAAGLELTLTPVYGTGGNHAGPADVGSAAPATVTVPGGMTRAEFAYPVAQDNLIEFNEEFRLVLGTGTATAAALAGWVGGAIVEHVVLITPQSGKVAFGADPASTGVHTASVSEGAGTLKVPISIDVPPGRAAAIAVAVRAGGTAVENTDFTIPVKTFTFTPTGGTARTVTIELTDDLAIESDETIELEIVPNVPGGLEGTGPRALGENYVRHASGARATITVQDNDAAPGAPTGLALTPLDGGLALAWRAPALATVTGYDVHYTTAPGNAVADGTAVQVMQGGRRPSPINGWVDAGHRGTRPSHSIAGLANGTPVRVRVRAVNTGGGGTWAHATETPRIRTWGFSPFRYSIPSGTDAEVNIVLSEPAPPGGVAFALTTRLGLDIPAGLCGGDVEGAVEADLGATLPTMLTVPAGREEAKANFPTANNDDLAGSTAECFVVMASTAAPGWSAASSSSKAAEVTIGRHGTVTFGNNALNTSTYTASVAEDVSGGTLNVPVTVNRLPVRSTTIAVEVVTARTTATEYRNDANPGDFRIAAKSLTFGPDASRTQNLRVAITDDADVEDDEFIELKFATQSRSLYPELFNVARITIVDDELSAPTDLKVEAGDAKLDVSWTAPTGTVTAYDVHYTSAPASGDGSVADDAAVQTGPGSLAGDGWVDAGHTGTDPEHEITSLDNGTTYRVRVRARNDEADSAWATQSGTPKSADATLRTLTGSTSTDGRDFSGTLDIAAFAAGTTAYTVTVADNVTHVKLTPTVNQSDATVTVGKRGTIPAAVDSGSASAPIALDTGATGIEVEVTAQDGSTQTYAVTVIITTMTYALTPAVTAAEGANAELTVTLGEDAPAGGLDLAVAYGYSGSAAEADTGTTPSTVTVAEDRRTATLTIPLASDDLVEGEETFTATLSTSVSGWSAGSAGAVATVTITDEDQDDAKIAFGSDAAATTKYAASVAEDGGSLNVPVTVSHLPGSSTTFAVEVLGTGTAVEDTDYGIAMKSVTFGPTDGSRTKTVSVTITDDSVVEPDETIELKIAAADRTVDDLGDHYARDENGALATLTITNDDTRGLELSETDLTVTEAPGAGRTATYTVALRSQPTAEVTVTVASGDASVATVAPASLTFGTGAWSAVQTVTVTGVDDEVDNASDRTTTISHTAGGGDYGSESGTVAVTVTDDEGPASLSVDDASVDEGDSGTADLAFAVTLSPASDGEVTVRWATSKESADTAEPETDYAAGSGALTFAAGETGKTVTVAVTGDQVDEPDETLTVTLSNQTSGVSITDATATGTITDDDTATVSLALSPDSIAEDGGVSAVTASLSGTSSEEVEVTVSASPVGDAVSGDYTLSANTKLTIAAGSTASTETVTITANDNDVDTPNKEVTVSGASSGGNGVANPADQTLTITDDDARGLDLSAETVTVTEAGGAGRTATYTVALSSQPTAEVTVAVSSGAAGVATVAPASLTFGTGAWSAVQTVTVTGVDDDLDNAPDRTTTISHTAGGGDYGSVSKTVAVTVTDDEGTASLSVDDASVDEGDTGTANLAFAVTLSPASDGEVTVQWATSKENADTAEPGTDYAAGNGTLTFAAGETGKTVTVAVTGDAVDEPNETLTVTLSNQTSGVSIADATATGTITDDDATPTVALALSPASIGENGGVSTVTASLSGTSSEAVEVTVSASPVDPAVSGDYTLSANTKLTIAAGSTASTGTVTITGVNNDVDAPNKTVTVSGASSGGNEVANPVDQTLTITDDDATPTVTLGLSPASIAENGGVSTVTASLSGASSEAVEVTVSASPVDPAMSGDYTLSANTKLTIAAGSTASTETVTITANDNDVDAPNKTVTVSGASSGGNEVANPADQTLTITDDDQRGLDLSVETVTVTEATGTGRTATYTVALGSQPTATVTVTVSSGAAGVATVAPASLTFGTGTWSAVQTVTVTGVDDDLDNAPDRTTTITHRASGGDYGSVSGTVAVTVTDDEGSALSVADASVAEGDTGTADLAFAVTLSPASDGEVTVQWATSKESADTAEPGTDYAAGNGKLTFAAGETGKTVTVAVTGDAVDEPNETLTVTLSSQTSGVSITDATATGTITDDDATPTVSLALSPASIAEDGGVSTVTASLSGASSEAVEVTVSASPVDPAVSGDYTLSANTKLTIAAGSTASTGTVTITGVNNDVDAPNKTVTVSGASSGGNEVANPVDQTLTITDDDATPTVTLGLSPASIAENGGVSTVTASLSGASSEAVEVTVSASPVDPAMSRDYTLSANTKLTIAAGSTASTETVTITANDNDVDAANKTVTVSGTSSGGNGVANPADQTLTITDDDQRGLDLSVETVTVTEVAAGRTATYTVALSTEPTAEVTVAVSSGDMGVATVAPASLTFGTDTWSAVQTVTVTGVDDDLDNAPDRTTTITHRASGGDYGSVSGTVAVTVTDDEGSALSVADASVDEGDTGTADLAFAVTLSPASDGEVTVQWATSKESADTAEPETDYAAGSGTLTFAAGETGKTVTVTVTGDQVDEPNETLTVTLSNQTSGVSITDATATGTITDDDARGLDLSAETVTVTEAAGTGRTATYTVALSSQPTAEVTVTVSSGATGVATVAPASLTFGTGAWSAVQTVTVTGVDDTVDNASDRTTTISHTAGGGDYGSVSKTVAVTVTDDEGPASLSVADASVAEGDSGTANLAFAVTLSPASDGEVTVRWATSKESADTAEPETDYTAGSGTLTFATGETGKTVTVAVTGDQVDEPNETLTVTLSNQTSGVSITDATATGTITDDDTATVSLALSPASIAEDGGVSTVTASLSGTSSEAVEVTVSASPVSPAVAGDYTLSANTKLTIAAGATASTGTVTITANDNDVDAADKTVTVSGASSGGNGVANPADQTLTITDDDERGLDLSTETVTVTEAPGTNRTATYTVALSTQPTGEVTVAVSSGAAGVATVAPASLTFSTTNWKTKQTVTVTGVDDEVDNASDRTTTISHTAGGGDYGSVSKTVAVTVTDDEGPASLSVDDASVDEGDSGTANLAFAVRLSPASDGEVTVQWATSKESADTAEPATDYAAGSGTLTFAAGETGKTVTVAVTGDQVDEPNETLTVTLSNQTSGVSITDATATGTITDDDATPTVSLALSPTSIAEDGGVSTVTASLSGASSEAVEVTVSASPVSPAMSGDYTLSANTKLTIAAGSTASTGTVTITGVNNDVDAPNKTVTVSGASSGGNEVANPADQTLTITDDDDTPTVTLALSPASIGEDGGVSTVTASLSGTSSEAVEVTVSASPVSPAVAGDYTLSANTKLTIAAGSTASTGTVTITGVNNDVDAPNKTVTVSGASSGGNEVANPADQTLTITDDDTATVSLALSPASIAEDGGVSTVTASLSGTSSEAVEVTVSASPVSPAVAGDYTLSANTKLTIAAGSTASTETVTITANDNDVDAPNKEVTVSGASSGGNGVANPANQTLTITDDDQRGLELSKTGVTVTEAAAGRTATYTVALGSQPTAEVTVAVSSGATGVATVAPASLTFGTGAWSAVQTVTVTGVDDTMDNAPDRTTTITHRASGGDYGSVSKTVAVTVTDDEGSALSVDDASVNEGDSGTADLAFAVTLSPASDGEVTVQWATSDGTATAGTDYAAGSGTLTFATGETGKTVTVAVTGDQVDEPNETLTVTLSDQTSGVSITDATATGTITDDDTATVSLALSPASIGENGGVSTVTASLNGASSEAVEVTVSASPVDPAVSEDYTLSANTKLTIAAGSTASTETVTITGVNNDVDTANKTVTVSGASSGGNGVANPADQALTITDDDQRGLDLSAETVTVTEAPGAGRTATYTVALSSQPTAEVTVAVSSGAAGVATVSPASLTFGTGAWSAVQTVTVTGVDDTVDNASDRTTTISHTAGGGDYGSVSKTVAVTVTDNEGPASLSVDDASVDEGDSGTANLAFAVTLSPASDGEVTVQWATSKESGDTAEPASDYTAGSGTLTFAAGETGKTVTVAVTGDQVDEPDETLTVTLSSQTSGVSITDATATGTITDDDTATVSLALSPASIGENGGVSTVTASLSGTSSEAVEVTVSASPVSPATNADYALSTNTKLTIAAGSTASTGTVTITANDNDVDTANKTVTVSGASSGGNGVANPANQALTITDDDARGLDLSAETVTVTEAEGAGRTATYTVALGSQPTAEVTVAVSSGAAGVATVAPASLTFGTGAWSAVQTVTVTGVDDTVDNASDRTTTISHTAGGGDYGSVSKTVAVTVTDDEGSASLSVADASVDEGDTGTANLAFAVTLSPASDGEVTVQWATSKESADTAEPATDYAAGSGTLTFAAGETGKTVTVAVTGDQVDEPDETLTVTLSNQTSGVSITDATATGTITDDDTATVSLALSPASIAEDGGVSTVTASLNGTSSEAVEVTVSASPVGDAVAGDYTLSSNTKLTIVAGATASTGTVTITANDNDVDAANKTVTVSGASSGGNGVANPANQELTITDDDQRGLELSQTSVTVTEAAGTGRTATYTVALGSQPTAEVTVAVSSGAAGVATVAPASLTFGTGTWSAVQTVTVTGVDDDMDNAPDRTTTITHRASGGDYGSVSKTVAVTVTDDEGSALSVDDASVAEGDTGTANLAFAVTLSPASDGEVTVQWATSKESADTAEPATDYAAGSGSLTFAAGETGKTVTVAVTGDQVDEPNETLTVTLSNQTSGVSIADATATGTITDDDTRGLDLSAATVTVTEATGAGRTTTYTVALSSQPTGSVTVAVSSGAAGVATVAPASLTFGTGAWSAVQTVTVTGVDDTVDNASDRTTTITHRASGGDYGSVSKTVAVTVTDNEGPASLSVDDASVTEGDTGTANLAFAVTLSPASDGEVTVRWATSKESADTAEPGTDYAAGSGTLTFAAGETGKTVTVAVTGDQVDEPDETLTVTLSNQTSGVSITDATATGTITDDDTATVSLALSPASIAEDGGVSTVTASLSGTSSEAVEVTVSASPVSPAVAGDYTLSTNTKLTIAAGSTASTETVTITGVNNDVDTANKTVTVSGASSGGNGVTNPANRTLTITDDDQRGLDLSAETVTVTEATGTGRTATYTVALSSQPTAEVTVSVSSGAAGVATVAPASLTFGTGAWSAVQTVTVTGVDDTVDNASDRTTTISHTAGGGDYGSVSKTVAVTVTDDEGPASLSVDDASMAEGDSGTANLAFAVTLSPASDGEVTVRWATSKESADTAEPGTDYAAGNGTLTFAAGETGKTVTVAVTGDQVDEPDETLTVTLSSQTSGVSISDATATGTITDDDTATVSLALSPASIAEDGGVSTVTASLNGTSSEAVEVTVSASPVNPATNADYALSTNTKLTIAAGSTASTETVTITANDNDVDAPNKTVTVSGASSGGNGVANPANRTLTITDDDQRGLDLSVETVTVTEAAGTGRTATYTVALSSQPTAEVTVAVSSGAAGVATVAPASLTFGTGAWSAVQTVTVTGVDDTVDNASDRTTTISHTADGGDYGSVSGTVAVTVTDDDGSALSVADASVNEGDTGTANLAFAVTLSPASDGEVTVRWATSKESADTAEPETDYAAGSGTLTFAAGETGKTVTVAVTGDQVDEPNETLTVTLSSQTSGVSISDATATGTITDDDATPTVSLGLSPASIAEDGGVSTVTASLSGTSSQAVEVTVSASPVNPATNTDYTLSTNTKLTIAAGSTASTETVTITANDNDVDAANKTVTVSGASSGGNGVTNPANRTLTITDDDARGLELSAETVTVTEATGTGRTATYTVALSSQPTAEVTVAVTSGAAGVATVSPASLTFGTGAWSAVQTVTVTGVDDTVDNASDRTTTITHRASGGDYGSVSKTVAVTVTDNEGSASLSVTDASVAEGDSGTANLAFAVTLSPASDGEVTVRWATSKESADTAEPGTDYAAGSGTLTFAAGETGKTVTVAVTGDAVDEPNETLTVTLSNQTSGVSITDATATGTITDDDTATVSLALSPASIAEDGGVSTVTASLNGTSSEAVEVTVSASPVSPATNADYTLSTNTKLTIAAGSTASTETVTITGVDNDVDTANKTVTVSGASSGGNGVANPANRTLTITDDDQRGLELSQTGVTVTEAAGTGRTATYTVALGSQPTAAVTVAVSSGAAGVATVAPASLTFGTGAWSAVQTVTVTGVDDDLDNAPDRTTTITHRASGGDYGSVSGTVAVTVTDNEGAASLSVADASVTEGDTGTADLAFAVTLSPASDAEVTVRWATSDGTATAGSDYTAGSGTLTFAAGETGKTVTVAVTGDAVDEPNETLTVTLSNQTSGVSITDATATGTITDDDEWTSLSVSYGDGLLSLDWTAPSETVTGYDVHYTSAPSTGEHAVADDADVQTGTEPSAAAGWVDASHSGTDPEHEITGLDNGTAYRVRVRAKISGGDTRWVTGAGTPDELPAVQFTESSHEILEANTDATAITLTASVAPPADITVGIGYASGGATPATSAGACQAGWDHRRIPSAFTWSAEETELEIPVTACDDDLREDERSSEFFTLTIEPGDGYTVGARATATVSIRDDDTAFAPPGKPVLEAVTTGDDAPTATTLSFTVSCVRKGSGGVTGYTLSAVARDDPSLVREQQFPSEQCGSGGPMTLTGLPLRSAATTWVVTATARDLRGGSGLASEPVELATLADTPQPGATPLTAAFAGAPSEHTGNGTFSFTVNFSVSLDGGQEPTARSFEVSHGAVTRLAKVSSKKWTVHVRPQTWRAVGVALRGGRSCDDPRAVCATGGRALSNSPSATIGAAAQIRVSGNWAREAEGAQVRFQVSLSRAVSDEVRVDYATQDGDGALGGNQPATAGLDYTATSGTLTFEPGETRKRVNVTVLNDTLDEGGEYFRLMPSNPQGAWLPARHSANLGLILNSDPLQRMWLSRFGRTVGGHVTAAVSGRLDGLAPGAHATLAGQPLDLSGTGDGAAQAPAHGDPFARHGSGGAWDDAASAAAARPMTGSEVLLGSSFHVAGRADGPDGPDGPGPGLAAWGRMAQGRFDGEETDGDGRMRIDGEVLTGTLGADADFGWVLAGVAVSLSRGAGTFDSPGVDSGTVASTLVTASPYARFRLTERVSAWGLGAYGTGAMTMTQDARAAAEGRAARPKQVTEAPLSMLMGAAGARGALLTPGETGGIDLALRADAFFVRMESGQVPNSAATAAAASRLRLVLEGGRSFDVGDGAMLRPSLEVGVRHDGGDAETGAGVEVGGAMAYADPSSGLSLEATARMLVAHADADYQEWGVSATARLAPGERGRGLSFSLSPTLGATASASERLWGAQDARALAQGAELDAARGFRAEAGYGMALFGDRVTGTPNLGFGLAHGGARDWRIGWRLTSAVRGDPGFEVSLDAMRREPADRTAPPEHGVMLRSLIRW